MKTFVASSILALAASTMAAPVADAAAAQPQPFTAISARSGSPIHLMPINASGEKFYLGRNTATYCPLKKSECPPGKVTAFLVGSGGASMDTEVPGGQQVYIAPDGSLSFTQAHSASMPTGSITTGFSYTPGEPGEFSAKKSFLACPLADGSYQVYADVKGFKEKNCLGFDALTAKYKGVAAWQYT